MEKKNIKWKRPQGTPPKKPIPKILYWIGVFISTLLTKMWLVMSIIGGIGGYYIGHDFEMVAIGAIVGLIFGFVFFKDE